MKHKGKLSGLRKVAFNILCHVFRRRKIRRRKLCALSSIPASSTMSVVIQSLFVKTYVNCVRFLSEKYLLATAGNALQVYSVSTSELLKTRTIFESERIHGIVINSDRVLLFGGSKLALVQLIFENENIAINIIHQWTSDQWVQDATFLHNNTYGVLGSSNVLYYYKTENGKVLLEKIFQCKEKSVLYCGKILGTSWSNTVVLCGTVFSQITIWSPMLDECNIVHRLIGHQGVIFSVTYYEGNQTICSTSDDRSIRVWQVIKEDSDNIVQSWKYAKITLVSSIFGHTARVWRNLQLNDGKIVSIGEDGQLKVWCGDRVVHSWNTHQNGNIWSLDYNETYKLIVTGGGDAGIYAWPLSNENNLCEPQQMDIKLEPDDFPRQVLIAKNMKLLLYTNNGIILSCGPNHCKQVLEDTRFRSYCILSISKHKDHYAAASITGDVLIFHGTHDEIVSEYSVGKEKIFSFHWLSETHFVLCKPQGVLMLLQLFVESNQIQAIHNFILPVCKERWLTAAVLTDNLLICGDRDGSIHVYDTSNQSLLKTYHKIHSRLGVSCMEYASCSGTLLSIGRDGFLRHWEIAPEINKNNDGLANVRTHRSVGGPTHETSTNSKSDSIVDSSCEYVPKSDIDVGKVSFRTQDATNLDRLEKRITFEGNSNSSSGSVHNVGSSLHNASLFQVSADKLPLEWPAHIYSDGSDTFIVGFHEVHFVIWSTREQKIIFKLQCGGGHRSWDYYFRGSHLYFSFIKQKRVYHVNVDLFQLTRPAIVQSFHRDEINALMCVRMDQEQLIVSGGEDNTLRISLLTQKPQTSSHNNKKSSTRGTEMANTTLNTLHGEENTVQTPFLSHKSQNSAQNTHTSLLSTTISSSLGTETSKSHSSFDTNNTSLHTCLILRSHISSIRCLSYVHVGQDVYIASGGGRAQMKIWKLSQKDKNNLLSEFDSFSPIVNNSFSHIENNFPSSTFNNSSSFLENPSINAPRSQKKNDNQHHILNVSHDRSTVVHSSCCQIDNNTSSITTENSAKISQDNSKDQQTNNRRSDAQENTLFQYQCKELFSHMLNGEDRKEKSWRLATPRINPETRYMDMALHHEESRLYLATACSDGLIRIFLYNIETNSFSCLQELDYHGKCILKVHVVQFGATLLLCSLSTNGYLALWDFRSLMDTASQKSDRTKSSEHHSEKLDQNYSQKISNQKLNVSNINHESTSEDFNLKPNANQDTSPSPLATYKLHEGGVNCFDSRPLGSHLFLASGGDDCSLVLTVLNADLKLTRQMRQLRAHHSQITGVKFLDDNRLVSSSVDQRIVFWTWDELRQQNKNLRQDVVKVNQHHSDLNTELNEQLIQLGFDSENLEIVDQVMSEEGKDINRKGEETSKVIKDTHKEKSKEKKGGDEDLSSNYQKKIPSDAEINSNRQVNPQLIRLGQKDSCIPDIHGLDLMIGNQVCVFGCGVQIVQIVEDKTHH